MAHPSASTKTSEVLKFLSMATSCRESASASRICGRRTIPQATARHPTYDWAASSPPGSAAAWAPQQRSRINELRYINWMTLSRRTVLGAAAAAAAVLSTSANAQSPPPMRPRPIGLKPMTGDAKPITAQERQGRLAKVQGLMQEKKIAALLVESGSTLEYFTGIHWWTSERVTAAIIPATGQVIVVTPFFESPSIHEMLQVPAEIRPWQEDENPFELIARSVGGMGEGPLAVDSNVRFFITDAVTKAGHRATVP